MSASLKRKRDWSGVPTDLKPAAKSTEPVSAVGVFTRDDLSPLEAAPDDMTLGELRELIRELYAACLPTMSHNLKSLGYVSSRVVGMPRRAVFDDPSRRSCEGLIVGHPSFLLAAREVLGAVLLGMQDVE